MSIAVENTSKLFVDGLASFASTFAAKVRRPPNLRIDEWVIKKRNQKFKNHPWQPGIYQSFKDPAVQETCLLMASQESGKTEIGLNVLGYHVEHKPCEQNVLRPDDQSAAEFMKEKFMGMINDPGTTCFNGLISGDGQKKTGGNTVHHKMYPGGFVAVSGGVSPRRVAARSARVLWADEIDRLPASAGKEGDPLELFWNRAGSYSDVIKLVTSTPTIKGSSRIQDYFDRSDKQYWFVPCPHCGTYQTLKWKNVDWSDKGTEQVPVYVCEAKGCFEAWTDRQRMDAIRIGEWRATAPFNGIRGHHLSGLYSLRAPQRGFKSRLQEMVKKFLSVKGDPFKMRVWVNTFLAESWVEEAETIDSEMVQNRREFYPHEVPDGVLLLTAGVDVQHDGIYAEIVGTGMNNETWGIEYGEFAGDTLKAEVWKELDQWLLKDRKNSKGIGFKVACTLIDSGEGKRTTAVYRFCRPRRLRRVFPSKGSSVMAMPLATPSTRKTGLVIVGTDTAKSELYGCLKINEPGEGFCHFGGEAQGYDDTFFKQLTIERAETTYSRGKKVTRFVCPENERNEALDTRVYAMAAAYHIQPNFAALANNLDVRTKNVVGVSHHGEPGSQHEPRLDPSIIQQAPSPPKEKRRIQQSSWSATGF